MAGRKRRYGVPRGKDGKIKRSVYAQDDVRAVAMAQRKRTIGKRGDLANPLLGSSIGRLYDSGYITSQHYDTAQAFHELSMQYRAATGIMSPTQKAIDYSRPTIPSTGGAPENEDYERAARIVRRYTLAVKEINSVGIGAFDLFTSVILFDEPTTGWGERQYRMMRAALDALDKHFTGHSLPRKSPRNLAESASHGRGEI